MTNRVAWIAGIVIGLSCYAILKRDQSRLEALLSGGARVPVLVAAHDLAVGDPVDEGALERLDMPLPYLEERHVTLDSLERVEGLSLLRPLRSGEALLWGDLIAAEESEPLSALVESGSRAMTLRVRGVGAQVRVGDRIDLLLRSQQQGEWRVRPLLESVLVLAVDGQGPGDSRPTLASESGFLSVSVTPRQAQLVTLAQGRGELQLLLRHPADLATSSQPLVSSERELDEALGFGVESRGRLPHVKREAQSRDEVIEHVH